MHSPPSCFRRSSTSFAICWLLRLACGNAARWVFYLRARGTGWHSRPVVRWGYLPFCNHSHSWLTPFSKPPEIFLQWILRRHQTVLSRPSFCSIPIKRYNVSSTSSSLSERESNVPAFLLWNRCTRDQPRLGRECFSCEFDLTGPVIYKRCLILIKPWPEGRGQHRSSLRKFLDLRFRTSL